MRVRDFAVTLTGGMHQALHLLPVAESLRARGHNVAIYAMDAASMAFAARMLAPGAALTQLAPGPIERLAARNGADLRPRKRLRLIENRRLFADVDALIAAERTTSALRRWRLVRGFMIHIPHGAGDRAVGYEARIARFDFHIVAGPKDRERFIASHLALPDRIAACGYIKLAGIARMAAPSQGRLFSNDRPIVLYNPHFDAALGSWKLAPALLESFASRPDLNFIVAPHIRLADRLTAAERAHIVNRSAPNILIDLGSEASCDMRYANAADIYLGDVSSQVYEFETRPRPAIFIDAAVANWRGNPDFAMWEMGEVVAADAAAAMHAIDAAPARHAHYVDRQRALVAYSLGDDWAGAPDCAADEILRFLNRAERPQFRRR